MSGHTTSTLEEEEKVTWAIPNCKGIGEESGVLTNCKDMEMIYNIPLEYECTSLQNHSNIDLKLETHGKLDETKDENLETPNSEKHDDIEEELSESQELGGTAHDWSQVNQVETRNRSSING